MRREDKRRDVGDDRRERAKCQRETSGKYFYDLSKLTFTALVLGAVLTYFQGFEISGSVVGMFLFGIFLSAALAIAGNKILK